MSRDKNADNDWLIINFPKGNEYQEGTDKKPIRCNHKLHKCFYLQ